MIQRIVAELGPWSWWVLGLILLAAEILMPGVFLIWIGIAAIIVGCLSLLFWNDPFWIWQTQILVFAVLAIGAAVLGRRLMARSAESDEPLLNKRGESLVGRTATLSEPISEGRGRIKIDDTMWVVNGPDLPVGARVRVVESTGRELRVESV